MTEKRRDWGKRLAESLKRCADPKLPCAGCLFDHVCEKQEESGLDIMVSGANMIEELLGELNDLNTVNGHLKEMAGERQGCCGKCNDQKAAVGDPSAAPQDDSKGQAWQMGLYERAIEKFGEKKQVTKAVEELGELVVELSRWLNAEAPADEHLLSHIREELADVCIMCDQLQLIFGDVSDWEMYKLERLERKLVKGL